VTKAFIVWNEDKTEGVIFIDEDAPDPNMHTAEQDALWAADEIERAAPMTSALADRWRDLYDEGGCSVVETTAEALRDL